MWAGGEGMGGQHPPVLVEAQQVPPVSAAGGDLLPHHTQPLLKWDLKGVKGAARGMAQFWSYDPGCPCRHIQGLSQELLAMRYHWRNVFRKPKFHHLPGYLSLSFIESQNMESQKCRKVGSEGPSHHPLLPWAGCSPPSSGCPRSISGHRHLQGWGTNNFFHSNTAMEEKKQWAQLYTCWQS